jgi:biopolymer transport protein ExbD
MPSVKIPKKSTAVDMTPFVDVAFLILTFFIMATKFKPAEPVEIKTPSSVSTKDLPDSDALMVTFDSTGRVFFSVLAEKDPVLKYNVIKHMNDTRNLGLSEAEMKNFVMAPAVGVPFGSLKQLLAVPAENHKDVKQQGIPLDTLGGELYYWIRDAVSVFSGKQLKYLVKGDNNAKYPNFKMVLGAFKRNDIYKFNLITMLEDAPMGSDLYTTRKKGKSK